MDTEDVAMITRTYGLAPDELICVACSNLSVEWKENVSSWGSGIVSCETLASLDVMVLGPWSMRG